MSLSSELNRRDVESAFRVLDGDDATAVARPDALALATAARQQWQHARIAPEQVDFDALDRSLLRAVAEERLRTNERRQMTRVLFPGLGLAAALAAIGLVLASRFGGDAPVATGSAVAAVITPPQPIGVGTRLSSGEKPMAAAVGVATVTLDPRSDIEVLTDESLLTRVSVDGGSVRFEVAPRPVGGRFEVVAGRAVVTVVGTGFRVERLGDATVGERVAVSVEHGIVLVQSPDGQTVRLTRGESVTVPAREAPPTAVAADDDGVGRPAPEAMVLAPAATPTAEPVVANTEASPAAVAEPASADELAAHDLGTDGDLALPTAPRARGFRSPPSKGKKPAPSAAIIAPTIVVPGATGATTQTAPKVTSTEPATGKVDMVVETSVDDQLGTAQLRELVAGLGPTTCSARVSGLRQWIAEQPGHGRLRIGQHALAYCYHALGRTADADRLFRRLGFKLKDILEPKPPAFR